ncbi:MAG TPA: 4'-phosphopantetheinyl transferase superfamily protein [Gallionella sp.]|nr:4'-phosphopantetheinyl transferase superfamily protein [Gallionella sp.]
MQNFLIPSGEVHLWLCELGDAIPPDLHDKCEKLLSPDEVARMERFYFEKHRSHFLISHAFLRIVLSRYQGCSPASIAYSFNEYGKPFLQADAGQSGISFNLSHTDGLACCAIAKDGDVGVDVECLDRLTKGDEIGKQFFAPEEFADMMAIDNEETRKERFLHLWLLKEAFIKAKGTGLSLPLDLFCFNFPGYGEIGVSFAPRLAESPEDWHFRLFHTTENHRAAIACKQASSHPDAPRHKTFRIFSFCIDEDALSPKAAS